MARSPAWRIVPLFKRISSTTSMTWRCGQRGEITTRHPCSRFPSVAQFVVTQDSNFSITRAETFTDAQNETRFVMVNGEDNTVLVDLFFSASFFERRLTSHHLCRRDVNTVFTGLLQVQNTVLGAGSAKRGHQKSVQKTIRTPFLVNDFEMFHIFFAARRNGRSSSLLRVLMAKSRKRHSGVSGVYKADQRTIPVEPPCSHQVSLSE